MNGLEQSFKQFSKLCGVIKFLFDYPYMTARIMAGRAFEYSYVYNGYPRYTGIWVEGMTYFDDESNAEVDAWYLSVSERGILYAVVSGGSQPSKKVARV